MDRPELNINSLIDILYAYSKKLEAVGDLAQIHSLVCDMICRAVPSDALYIGYYLEGTNALQVSFCMEEGQPRPEFMEPLENSIAGHVIARQEVIALNSSDEILQLVDPSQIRAIGPDERLPQSILCAPIIIGGEIFGVLYLQSYQAGHYPPVSARVLYLICRLIAPSLQPASNMARNGVDGHGTSGLAIDTVDSSEAVSSPEHSTSVLNQNVKLRSVIDLARRICHEMNQPLTGISGYCALIREELAKDHHAYEDLNQIEVQAQRLEQLIYNFQSIAQLEEADDTEFET
ncbi:GAF domain-containing protein [bacterium]|nr:GAF domain-containing protein [bacterium]